MPSIQEILSSKALVMLVGPAAVGKSTIMHTVTNLDQRFSYVRSFTSRPHREGEQSTYCHLSTEEAAVIEHDANTVTFLRHPTTRAVYGTTVDSFAGEYNLLDTLSSSVELYRDLPFKSCKVVSLTVNPDIWEMWMKKRYPTPSLERTKRLHEAIQSIDWSLSQLDNHAWIMNQPDNAEETARELIHIATSSAQTTHAQSNAIELKQRAVRLLSYE